MNDDYSDYSDNEEFHEDALHNEEYDALYAVLPEAKKALSSYNPNIPEIEIKEALYYHYFEIKPALEDLRAKFPKKKAKAKAKFNRPSPDDFVLEAQKQAFEKDMKMLSIDDAVEKKSGISTSRAIETKPFVKIDLNKELAEYVQPHMCFVVIGHVDAGKSTLMGRILYDTGTVDGKTINKLVREAEKSGKGSFALAWLLDQTAEERLRGITIDICSTSFKTEKMSFTAIDAPGHKDFIPQMISGVSQANIAVLVVDSIKGKFEAGFVMDGQTKEHTLLAKSLGLEQVCIAINKLDKEEWSQSRYEDIKAQLTLFFTSSEVGFSEQNLHFIPISGLTGVNVVMRDVCGKSTPELAWYKGPTLIELLEHINAQEGTTTTLGELLAEECNIFANEIAEILPSELHVQGKVSLGVVQAGETVRIHPTGDCLQVQSLSVHGKSEPVAVRGQNIQLKFKTNQLKNKSIDDLAVGDLILNLESSVRLVRSFEACITTFHMNKPLLVGTPFVLFRNNASVSARISKIILIKDSKRKKMHLVSNQRAVVEIEINQDRPLPVSEFSKNKALGRIVLRKEGVTIAAGTIKSVNDVN
ncbi:hypothetical protein METBISCDRAFT_14543 [Metschnikowia bicuspidata]|uniref:Elongation factor 1 alpha-like protein n=1 Tax=Metschnikowia bicuspidata TaxID=27322 RepID=A0A4P9ZG73_9ASCO|nr:hypothetical protein METBISCDRAFT_14543 [Metschnikowia bicuspidata]